MCDSFTPLVMLVLRLESGTAHWKVTLKSRKFRQSLEFLPPTFAALR